MADTQLQLQPALLEIVSDDFRVIRSSSYAPETSRWTRAIGTAWFRFELVSISGRDGERR